jgi:pantoate--beta-alanine ligase
MEIVRDPKAFQKLCFDDRCKGLTTALVPTMGFFHEGHLALMRWARENADKVYVSLFVNPTQFSPAEDYESYPRDTESDVRRAGDAGCDVLFMPEPEDMYPDGHASHVEVPELAERLCGASRPHHFKGVSTIVAMLLNLARPTYAIFGKKDRQQLAIIRRMARDLHFPTEIVGRPTVREADGLAMSSRNTYLTPGERAQAWHIQEGLRRAKEKVERGVTDAAEIKSFLQSYYRENILEGVVDYIEIVDGVTMRPVEKITPGAVAAAAVKLGKARLIDNIALIPEKTS